MKTVYILLLSFLVAGRHPVYAQTMLAKPGKSAADYQELIRKNFALRKELKELENKYVGLENERSVLILHIKELQEIKDSRSEVIQNLKNMIASLRIEMLKDPKLTKTIDLFNKEIKEKNREKKLLEKKVNQLKLEKKELIKKFDTAQAVVPGADKKLLEAQNMIKKQRNENKDLKRKNKETEVELKNTQALLKTADAQLTTKSKEIQSLDKNFKNKTQKLAEELKAARHSLSQTKEMVKLMETERKSGDSHLSSDIKQLNREKKELGKKVTKLEQKFKKADEENQKLNGKVTQLKDEIQGSEKINRQLMADFKKEQSVLRKTNKDLKKAMLKSAFEREHYEEQLKSARADKAMFEAKVHQLQERTLMTESKRGKVEEELEAITTKMLLKEAKVMALQEEKAKLEKKMVKYIERIADRKGTDMWGDGVEGVRQSFGESPKSKTKEQIAQQKLNMHYNLALAYDKRQMYNEEEKEYHKCLKINSKDADVHYNLAILYDDKLNKNRKAIEHYKKFLELNSSGQEDYRVKEWLLHAQEEERFNSESY